MSSSNLYDQLCSLVTSTPIGRVITAFTQDSHDLYKCYVHDFLKSVHRCNYQSSETMDLEYEVMT